MLIALAVAGAAVLAGQMVLLFVLGVGVGVTEGDSALDDFFDRLLEPVVDPTDPLMFAFLLASLGIMIPAVYLGYLVGGIRPIGMVASVAMRIRWRWLVRTLLPAAVTIATAFGLAMAIGAVTGTNPEPIRIAPATTVLAGVIALCLVPFQAAAEEFVFRGVMVQALGSWLPRKRWSMLIIVVVPTALFVSGHLYDLWGLTDVAVFALAAMWVTLRTGGIEAAISLHVLNNLGVFTLQIAGVLGDPSAESSGSLMGVLITAITSLGYCVVVERMARRRGIGGTSTWPEVGSSRPLEVPLPNAYAVAATHLESDGGDDGAHGPVYPPVRGQG